MPVVVVMTVALEREDLEGRSQFYLGWPYNFGKVTFLPAGKCREKGRA